MKILVTGAAGFIGYHLSKRLAARGDRVVGLDNLNDYYDVALKYGRLETLGVRRDRIRERILIPSETHPLFSFVKLDITDGIALDEVFHVEGFDVVCHLAAQAGVRYSLTHPLAYVSNNLEGFAGVLEACRHHRPRHLVFASSSSVYGLNQSLPFSTHDNVDHPVSLYAASKKSNELMAHVYSHQFGLPVTGLRFFTAYGPWGRPDMALFRFTRAILEGRPIDVYNDGDMKRDFTYIDDVVDGIVQAIDRPAAPHTGWNAKRPDPAASSAPYRIYNLGNGRPVGLLDFIRELEEALGRKAVCNLLPLQPGDVKVTWADVGDEMRELGYKPQTDVREGLRRFVEWYREYYRLS